MRKKPLVALDELERADLRAKLLGRRKYAVGEDGDKSASEVIWKYESILGQRFGDNFLGQASRLHCFCRIAMGMEAERKRNQYDGAYDDCEDVHSV